ncbi:MAG: DUF2079 domain-containing protein [Actinobacteria bacterium]|nr:DUF2079 domain-containing protein [Actinomycetota bacterium]
MSDTGQIVPDAAVGSAIRARLASVSAWAVAVWLGTALYAAGLSMEAIADHNAFRTGFDTAIYDQLLWLLAQGEEPFSTVLSRPMLADHFQPGLVLLTPLYWLGLGVPGMLAAQSIGLGVTAPALFALARSSGAIPALAAIPAFLWLACPWVASINLFEFRPSAFAPVLLVVGVLAAVQNRVVLLAVTTVLALSLKEDVSLTYVALGLILAYQGKRRIGGALAAGSALWFIASSRIMESLGGSDFFGQRFAGDRGDSVGEAVVWSLQHPLETVSDIASQSLLGLVALLVATGGLALLAPAWLLLAAPTALYNALSAYTSQHDLVHHYHQGTVVGLFVAAALGVRRLGSAGRVGRLAATAGLAIAAVVALVGGVRVHTLPSESPSLDRVETEAALDLIPPGVPVAATRSLLPHLSKRVEVYTLPEPFIRLDWGGSLSSEELGERAASVRWVAYVEGDQIGRIFTGELGVANAVPDVRPVLDREGFVVIARAGPLEILERR